MLTTNVIRKAIAIDIVGPTKNTTTTVFSYETKCYDVHKDNDLCIITQICFHHQTSIYT